MGNRFVFYVDQMAFMYIIDKPQVSSRIATWLLLFLDYDFKIVYKLGKSHFMADALSRPPNQEKPISVLNQTIDAHLFTLQQEWLHNVYDYLSKGMMPKQFTTS
jgi:hypothetical protein